MAQTRRHADGWRAGRLGIRLLLLAALLPPATPALALSQIASSRSGVRAVIPGMPVSHFWSPLPLTLHLIAEKPGTVLYRWGAGPGGWQQVGGPLTAPEGKQLLSIVHVGEDGSPGPVSTLTVRSDFRSAASHLRAANVALAVFEDDAAAAAGASSGTVVVTASVRGRAGAEVVRIGGADRYAVSAAISAESFDAADTVIIASGQNFPDALASAGLAGALESPILLSRRASIPEPVMAEISRLGASRAIICGGEAAVSDGVSRQLTDMGLEVERIGGSDRYETASMIAARIRQLAGTAGRVYVARGDLYPDALSLGPLAYVERAPILLVRPDSLPAVTRQALGRGYTSAAIAGGTNSVSAGVETAVRGIVGPTLRWGGADRYETAVLIAAATVAGGASGWTGVGIAKGTDYADALTGGVGVGRSGGVLMLTRPEVLSAPTKQALQAQVGAIREVTVFGGPVAVTPATFEEIRAIFR